MRMLVALALTGLIAAVPAARTALADIPPPYEVFSIGAQLEDAQPFPRVTSVVNGGPADKAGVKTGDGVIAIDDSYSRGGAPYYFFARGLGGRQGSEVRLVLLRGNSQVLVVKVQRTYRPG